MAAPTLTLINFQELDDADTNTGWNDLTTADTDIKVEGTGSMSGIFRADGEQGYYDHGSAPVTGAGKTVRGWIFTNNIAYMGTHAGDGYKLLMYDGTTTELKTVFGSDTYPGGWFNYIWDVDEFTTLTLANIQRWGIESGHASNAKNVTNTWMDIIRYLDGYSMTGGVTGDRVGFADIATVDLTNAYGVCSSFNDIYFATGTIQFGTGATAHWFEAIGDVLVFTEQNVAAGLYSVSAVGSGTNVFFEGCVLKSVGAADNTRFVIDMTEVNINESEIIDSLITRAGTIDYQSGQVMTGNTYDDCGIITPAGADISNSVVQNYGETADTAPTDGSAVFYNETTDPDTDLEGCAFVKGTVDTHAVEFGTSIPASITLRGMTFTGYGANSTNSSALNFLDTAGTITVGLVDMGTPTYQSAGATIVFVNAKTVTIQVSDASDLSDIESASVLLLAEAGGDLPVADTVTITRVTTTATVAHTAHGIPDGEKVEITNAVEREYNGVFVTTLIDANSYSYTVAGTPATPATGTILATGVIINGDTSVAGIVTRTDFPFSNDQPVGGYVRKNPPAPFYEEGLIPPGTLDANGFTATSVMAPD